MTTEEQVLSLSNQVKSLEQKIATMSDAFESKLTVRTLTNMLDMQISALSKDFNKLNTYFSSSWFVELATFVQAYNWDINFTSENNVAYLSILNVSGSDNLACNCWLLDSDSNPIALDTLNLSVGNLINLNDYVGIFVFHTNHQLQFEYPENAKKLLLMNPVGVVKVFDL